MDGQEPDSWVRLQRCFPELLTSPYSEALAKDVLGREQTDEALRWTLLRQVLEWAVLADESRRVQLGTSVPGLWRAGGRSIMDAPHPTQPAPDWGPRALNRLLMHGYSRWIDLAGATPLDLADMRAAGVKTISEIVQRTLTFGWMLEHLPQERVSTSDVAKQPTSGPRTDLRPSPGSLTHFAGSCLIVMTAQPRP